MEQEKTIQSTKPFSELSDWEKFFFEKEWMERCEQQIWVEAFYSKSDKTEAEYFNSKENVI